MYSDVASGKRLFGITVGELIDEYVKWRKKDVDGGKITAGRLGTIVSQLKHFKKYKSAETKIAELDRESLFDYAQYRRMERRDTQDVTIRNEQVTFNHMISFAYRNGYSHFDKFTFEQIRIKEVSRRDTFTLAEYDALIKYLRVWVAKKTITDDEIRASRLMVRDCILIATNTMLRVGELWQLKWRDIIGYEKTFDEAKRPTTIVSLNVRKETSKNRKSRIVTTRGGEYFKRLYERSKFNSADDYIFCGKSGDQRLSKKTLYDAWHDLMAGIKIEYKERNLTWYSCRHFGITCRLRAGMSVFDIAKVVGTGSIFIQEHYGHFDQSMAKAGALKNFSYSRDGIVIDDKDI
jgi:integrase